MGRYTVMKRGMCETADMLALNVAEKCIYLTAMGLRRQNITGMIYITVSELAEIVGMDEKEAEKALSGERLRKKLEFFADSSVLWIKDFVSQQFSGKLSPQQKKGIINRLMEYPDKIVKKFLAFNRDILNLSRQDLNQFDFDDIEEEAPSPAGEYSSPEPGFQNPADDENQQGSSLFEDNIITNNNRNTHMENIYYTHSYTLSDTSKQEQEQDQEQDQKKEPQQEPEKEPVPEDTPPFLHNMEYHNYRGSAVVPLDESVLSGSAEGRPPTLNANSRYNFDTAYNGSYSFKNTVGHRRYDLLTHLALLNETVKNQVNLEKSAGGTPSIVFG